MKHLEFALQDFVDALEIANDDAAFESAADRLAHRLGFRWFAYLGIEGDDLTVLSSYPNAWAEHYVSNGYEKIDPVIRRARSAQSVFRWHGPSNPCRESEQPRFFWEASQFGIREGVTVPIRGGFGRFAAFTVAGDDPDNCEVRDILQLAALYYHAHVQAKLRLGLKRVAEAPLTPRERQCLAWSAQGKRMNEIAAILSISTRTVVFHLENARAKLHASTLTQAVAKATKRGLLKLS